MVKRQDALTKAAQDTVSFRLKYTLSAARCASFGRRGDSRLKELSQDTGMSLSHLSAIERGAANPSMDAIEAISTALSVSPDWLFARRSGKGPMERAFVVRAHERRNLNAL